MVITKVYHIPGFKKYTHFRTQYSRSSLCRPTNPLLGLATLTVLEYCMCDTVTVEKLQYGLRKLAVHYSCL